MRSPVRGMNLDCRQRCSRRFFLNGERAKLSITLVVVFLGHVTAVQNVRNPVHLHCRRFFRVAMVARDIVSTLIACVSNNV
jgi:hypothetical protein